MDVLNYSSRKGILGERSRVTLIYERTTPFYVKFFMSFRKPDVFLTKSNESSEVYTRIENLQPFR